MRVPGGGLQEVLAVVEHDEHASIPQVVDERRGERAPGLLGDPERCRDALEDQAFVGERAELDHPAAILELVEHVGRDLQREPGLADTAGAREGEQRGRLEERARIPQLALSADERRELAGQVVGTGFDGP
jgi:hypothetical protein